MRDDVLDLFKRHQNAGRRIRVREYHSTVFPVVILRPDLKRVIQRFRLVRNPQHIRPHIIKRVGDVREENRLSGIKECQENHCQHIIRADSDEYLIAAQSVI